jgi:hypothetical protein
LKIAPTSASCEHRDQAQNPPSPTPNQIYNVKEQNTFSRDYKRSKIRNFNLLSSKVANYPSMIPELGLGLGKLGECIPDSIASWGIYTSVPPGCNSGTILTCDTELLLATIHVKHVITAVLLAVCFDHTLADFSAHQIQYRANWSLPTSP